jgi:hypothetical protein
MAVCCSGQTTIIDYSAFPPPRARRGNAVDVLGSTPPEFAGGGLLKVPCKMPSTLSPTFPRACCWEHVGYSAPGVSATTSRHARRRVKLLNRNNNKKAFGKFTFRRFIENLDSLCFTSMIDFNVHSATSTF